MHTRFSEISLNIFSAVNFLLGDFIWKLLHFQNVSLFGILNPLPIIYYLKINAEDMPFHMPKFKHVFYIYLYYLHTCYICLEFVIKLKICGSLHFKLKLIFPNYTTFCLQFFRLLSISQSFMPCHDKPSLYFANTRHNNALEYLAILTNITLMVTDACVKIATRFC